MNCIADCGNQDVPVYKTIDDGFMVSRIRWCQCGARWRTDETTNRTTLVMAPRPVISDRRRSPVTSGDRRQSPVVTNDKFDEDDTHVSAENSLSRAVSKATALLAEGGLGVGPVSGPVCSSPSQTGPQISQPPILSEFQSDERDVRAVFNHYRLHHPRAFPRPRSDSKEWRAIAARMREGYGLNHLCRAIDGYHASPWHQGENDRGSKFLDLSLIMRDGSHVAKGIELADGPAPVASEKELRGQRAAVNVLERARQLGFGGGGK